MRVLWPHNFNPDDATAGTFMHLFAEGLRKLGVDLTLCYLGNLRSLRTLCRAGAMVKDMAPDFDLVHAQFGSACSIAVSFVKNTPKILSLRGSDWYRYKASLNLIAVHGFIATAMTRIALKKYDAVITMSHRMANEVKQMYPATQVCTIPDPINLEIFRPLDKCAARAALGFSGDKDKWVLFTALDEKSTIKRVGLARETVKRANERMPGIKLRVASGIPCSAMPLFVGACDLVLSTSTHEGWPNCIKEALACNIPFVSTDVSDLSMIAAQEHLCRVCPPDPDVLADNVCEVLAMPDSASLRRHVTDMDIFKTCKKLFDFYTACFQDWPQSRLRKNDKNC